MDFRDMDIRSYQTTLYHWKDYAQSMLQFNDDIRLDHNQICDKFLYIPGQFMQFVQDNNIPLIEDRQYILKQRVYRSRHFHHYETIILGISCNSFRMIEDVYERPGWVLTEFDYGRHTITVAAVKRTLQQFGEETGVGSLDFISVRSIKPCWLQYVTTMNQNEKGIGLYDPIEESVYSLYSGEWYQLKSNTKVYIYHAQYELHGPFTFSGYHMDHVYYQDKVQYQGTHLIMVFGLEEYYATMKRSWQKVQSALPGLDTIYQESQDQWKNGLRCGWKDKVIGKYKLSCYKEIAFTKMNGAWEYSQQTVIPWTSQYPFKFQDTLQIGISENYIPAITTSTNFTLKGITYFDLGLALGPQQLQHTLAYTNTLEGNETLSHTTSLKYENWKLRNTYHKPLGQERTTSVVEMMNDTWLALTQKESQTTMLSTLTRKFKNIWHDYDQDCIQYLRKTYKLGDNNLAVKVGPNIYLGGKLFIHEEDSKNVIVVENGHIFSNTMDENETRFNIKWAANGWATRVFGREKMQSNRKPNVQQMQYVRKQTDRMNGSQDAETEDIQIVKQTREQKMFVINDSEMEEQTVKIMTLTNGIMTTNTRQAKVFITRRVHKGLMVNPPDRCVPIAISAYIIDALRIPEPFEDSYQDWTYLTSKPEAEERLVNTMTLMTLAKDISYILGTLNIIRLQSDKVIMDGINIYEYKDNMHAVYKRQRTMMVDKQFQAPTIMYRDMKQELKILRFKTGSPIMIIERGQVTYDDKIVFGDPRTWKSQPQLLENNEQDSEEEHKQDTREMEVWEKAVAKFHNTYQISMELPKNGREFREVLDTIDIIDSVEWQLPRNDPIWTIYGAMQEWALAVRGMYTEDHKQHAATLDLTWYDQASILKHVVPVQIAKETHEFIQAVYDGEGTIQDNIRQQYKHLTGIEVITNWSFTYMIKHIVTIKNQLELKKCENIIKQNITDMTNMVNFIGSVQTPIDDDTLLIHRTVQQQIPDVYAKMMSMYIGADLTEEQIAFYPTFYRFISDNQQSQQLDIQWSQAIQGDQNNKIKFSIALKTKHYNQIMSFELVKQHHTLDNVIRTFYVQYWARIPNLKELTNEYRTSGLVTEKIQLDTPTDTYYLNLNNLGFVVGRISSERNTEANNNIQQDIFETLIPQPITAYGEYRTPGRLSYTHGMLQYVPDTNFQCRGKTISRYLISQYSEKNSKQQERSPNVHQHPWCRFTTTMMIGNLYATLRGQVIDIGSKYHQIVKFAKHLQIVCIRPDINEYDRTYFKQHDPITVMNNNANMRIIKTTFEDMTLYAPTYTCIDAIYYIQPSAIKNIFNTQATLHIIYNESRLPEQGKSTSHYAFSGEAMVVVQHQANRYSYKMTAQDKSYNSYGHQAVSTGALMRMFQDMGLQCEVQAATPLGMSIRQVWLCVSGVATQGSPLTQHDVMMTDYEDYINDQMNLVTQIEQAIDNAMFVPQQNTELVPVTTNTILVQVERVISAIITDTQLDVMTPSDRQEIVKRIKTRQVDNLKDIIVLKEDNYKFNKLIQERDPKRSMLERIIDKDLANRSNIKKYEMLGITGILTAAMVKLGLKVIRSDNPTFAKQIDKVMEKLPVVNVKTTIQLGLPLYWYLQMKTVVQDKDMTMYEKVQGMMMHTFITSAAFAATTLIGKRQPKQYCDYVKLEVPEIHKPCRANLKDIKYYEGETQVTEDKFITIQNNIRQQDKTQPLATGLTGQQHYMAATDKNVLNGFLNRHCGHQDMPDPMIVKEFKEYTQKTLANVPTPKIEFTTLQEYLNTLTGNRKKTYIAGYKELCNTPGVPQNIELMLKQFETTPKPVTGTVDIRGKDHMIITPDIAPRNLQNPSPQLKVLKGYFAYNLNRLYPQLLPNNVKSCTNLNMDEIQDELQRKCKSLGEYSMLSFDASRHDAHQHITLMQAFDDQLIAYMLKHYDHPFTMFTKNQLYKILTQRTKYFVLRSTMREKKRKAKRLLTGTIKGTVISGDALDTTMNTPRVCYYIGFYIDKSGIKNVNSYSLGDDAIMVAKTQDIISIRQTILDLSYQDSMEQVRMKGLGQVYKSLEYSNRKVQFLSKEILMDQGKILIYPKLDRMLSANEMYRITPGTHDYMAYMRGLLVGYQHSHKYLTYGRKRLQEIASLITVDGSKVSVKNKYQMNMNHHENLVGYDEIIAIQQFFDYPLDLIGMQQKVQKKKNEIEMVPQPNSVQRVIKSNKYHELQQQLIALRKEIAQHKRSSQQEIKEITQQVKQKYGDKTPGQIDALRSDGEMRQILQKFESFNSQTLVKAVGLKIADQAAQNILNKHFNALTTEERRRVLEDVLGDDWAQLLRTVGPPVLKFTWDKVKQIKPIQSILKSLRDTLGIDLNDDVGYNLGNRFTADYSATKQLDWSTLDMGYKNTSQAYNGVSTQAVAATLFPEYTRSRIPNGYGGKTGLLHRTIATNITTNASGNAIWLLCPQALGYLNWINLYNDATLNVQTGVQSVAPTATSGPLYTNTAGIITWRVTATSIEIQPIVAATNNQGRVTVVMSNEPPQVINTDAIIGADEVRDKEFVNYISLANAAGHRAVYVNSSQEDDAMMGQSDLPPRDYIGIVVQGAAATSQVLTVIVSYQAEYVVQNNQFIDIQPPPPGIATQKLLASAVAMKPELRTLGKQEATELYEALINTRPTYEDVLSLLTGKSYKHSNSRYDSLPVVDDSLEVIS